MAERMGPVGAASIEHMTYEQAMDALRMAVCVDKPNVHLDFIRRQSLNIVILIMSFGVIMTCRCLHGTPFSVLSTRIG